jgi:competence ComEA-like helix-hairpin-helix protein
MVVTDAPQHETGAVAERSIGFGVAICLGAAAAAILTIAAVGRTTEASPQTLGERINPNTAAASSLVRLPRIGWSKAQAVVMYRERHLAVTPATPAFRSPGDLTRIPGFGPRTVESISAWLDFGQAGIEPEASPSTPLADGR